MQRWYYPIYNGTTENLIWSKMWKMTSFFWLGKVLISVSFPWASYRQEMRKSFSQRTRKWKWTVSQQKTCISNSYLIRRGRGCRGAMIPAKMTSEPQDLQNYLQAPQNWSPSLSDVTKPTAILSPRPAFWSPLVVFIFCLNLLA